MRALIGHTGFIGRNLARQRTWDACFSRQDIDAIRGRSFELVVCAGLPSDRWLANGNPGGDRSNMLSLANALAEVHAERFVLVSTIDVYPVPVGVDESTVIEPAHNRAYGEHRLEFERMVAARFAADVMGVPTIVLARTDAEAANLLTSDHDANDKPFLTGERTPEGFYRVKNGLEQAISRGIAYAPYADLVWCETGTPDLGFAREFAQAVQQACPGKLLSYNCSPSFNWKKNLDDATIAKFQEELCALGYKYQFITLAGIHINWYNTFQFAHAYARGEGMKHYVEMVQEPEFRAREQGYTFVSHQQEVGAGYFDDVTTVIQGGKSSVTALTGSTEEEQFH